MSTARQRFEAMLAGRCNGPPAWLPLMDVLPARVTRTGYREMTADAGQWCAGLVTAAELLGADAIVAGCDPTLTAEACGAALNWDAVPPALASAPAQIAAHPLAAPRQAALVEVLRRLGATARARFGIVAVLAGPATLARQLCPGQPFEEALRQLRGAQMLVAEALLQARPDLLLLTERMPAPDAEPERAWQRAFGTLRNAAAHYDVPLALRVENWGAGHAAWLAGLRLQAVLLGPGSGDALALARELAASVPAVGVPVTAEDVAARAALADAVGSARAAGANLFLSTAGAVGGQGDLAVLREFGAVRQAAA
ncbi:MAG: hypothetical protein FJ191_11465 [Gammaproteobacteria bacterium]|nr:hypothetical protein [Gammaproteobacteria bacterium]